MRSFGRALVAELKKMRSTAALWLALGIPLLVGALMFLVWNSEQMATRPMEARWGFSTGILLSIWTSMALPMGAAILIGLLWGLEHHSGHLKHVLALPPSRGQVFWAKSLAHLMLLLLGTLCLSGALCLAAGLTDMTPLRFDVLLRLPLLSLLGSLPAVALVSWVAQRSGNFVLPMGLGVVGMVVGLIAAESPKYWHYVPWSWGIVAARDAPEQLLEVRSLALGFGLLISCLAWLHFLRRDAPC